MVYTHLPFLGIPPYLGTKVISPLSPLCQASPSPPQLFSSEQYDRQMKGHFSPSHGGLFRRKYPVSPLPYALWPGSAAGQSRTSLIAPIPPVLSTQYCNLPCPSLPSVCPSHRGVPPTPTPMMLYRVHFYSESSFCPSQ